MFGKQEPGEIIKMTMDKENALKKRSCSLSNALVSILLSMLIACCIILGILMQIQRENQHDMQIELHSATDRLIELNRAVNVAKDNTANQKISADLTEEGKFENKMATRKVNHIKPASNSLVQSQATKKERMYSTNSWLNMRLPKTIVPTDYDITLDVNMKDDTYQGDVRIDINVTQPTDNIILHVVGLDIIKVNVTSGRMPRGIGIKKEFKYNPNEFYVIQTNTALVKDGQYTINIKYTGQMGTELNGFYKSFYNAGGIQKKVASTFFSPISARKAFPCFDEPSLKATFSLTLTHNATYTAQSNMKAVSTCTQNGIKTTKFKTTLKMSTYILCWVISEYNFIESIDDNRISAWAENVDDVRFGLETSTKLLAFYEQYFNISFPLAKLDIVSIPSFGPGAMENWGIITFRAERILIDQRTSTEYLRQKSFNLIAHELVHQWFGNLVTMEFWNDAWLKEGFANNIGQMGGHHVDRSMASKEQVLTGFMIPALEVDSYSTSHPISSNVKTPGEIRGVFDSITYNKGSCLVDLVHIYLGDEDFQKGLQSYLKTYAYKNANQDNLWEQLSKVSGKDVESVMNTWTLQLGYPLVSVKRINESFVELRQTRFSLDPSNTPPPSPFNYIWKIPIIFKSPSNQKIISYLFEKKEGVFYAPEEYSIINPNHSLFYRVEYDETMMSKINTILSNEPNQLTAQDRTGLISDQFSFVTAKMVDIKTTLNLLSYLSSETDYYPWQVALEQLTTIKYFISSKNVQEKFDKFISKITANLVSKIGWKNTTTFNEGALQVLVLKHSCQAGSKSFIEAKKYYLEWMFNGGRNLKLRPSLHPVFMECAIRSGEDAFWDFTYLKYINTGRSDSLLWPLTSTIKINKIKQLLQLSLNIDVIDSQYTPYVVSNLAERSYEARKICWQFIKDNWNVIHKRYATDVFMLSDMLSAVLNRLSTEEDLFEVKRFFKINRDVGSGKNAVKRAINKIEANIEWKKTHFKQFLSWLDQQSI